MKCRKSFVSTYHLLGFTALMSLLTYMMIMTIPNPNVQERKDPEHAFNFIGTTLLNLNEDLLCHNKPMLAKTQMRGKYWVMYNYIQAKRVFNCHESITYTTHGGPEFLHNLEPLLERWMGPVSVGVYAPGTDYLRALKAIFYLRQCSKSNIVKELATFHLFFDADHLPEANVLDQDQLISYENSFGMSCDKLNKVETSYIDLKNLTYPINVARNVARESANTYFIFPSDIELYPSPGLIKDFLMMVKRNGPILKDWSKPKVFVNAIFEIKEGHRLPETKKELVKLIQNNTAFPFHQNICSRCHAIPGAKEWIASPSNGPMETHAIAKRKGAYGHWEPFYIGTHGDPLYDERLSWEGKSDKLVQGYTMCLMDYDFHVLNNAFLIHRPGIKYKSGKVKRPKVWAQGKMIRNKIVPQLQKLFGKSSECRR